ncbi:MAG: ROK family protein, partial [Nitrospiraceae bacterium]|nr:ROK family protein [Nitrospiraceae bacterium]
LSSLALRAWHRGQRSRNVGENLHTICRRRILEAHYLGSALATWVCTLSPQRIVIGGGVMQRDFLFPMIRQELRVLLNGYIPKRALIEQTTSMSCPHNSGITLVCSVPSCSRRMLLKKSVVAE